MSLVKPISIETLDSLRTTLNGEEVRNNEKLRSIYINRIHQILMATQGREVENNEQPLSWFQYMRSNFFR
jgi:hypothetical protein